MYFNYYKFCAKLAKSCQIGTFTQFGGKSTKKNANMQEKQAFFFYFLEDALRLYCLETRAKPIKKRAKNDTLFLY